MSVYRNAEEAIITWFGINSSVVSDTCNDDITFAKIDKDYKNNQDSETDVSRRADVSCRADAGIKYFVLKFHQNGLKEKHFPVVTVGMIATNILKIAVSGR